MVSETVRSELTESAVSKRPQNESAKCKGESRQFDLVAVGQRGCRQHRTHLSAVIDETTTNKKMLSNKISLKSSVLTESWTVTHSACDVKRRLLI